MKCPQCDGTGRDVVFGMLGIEWRPCPACDGSGRLSYRASRRPTKHDRYVIDLRMGYWPAVQQDAYFTKEPNRTQALFLVQGYLVSEVIHHTEEQGWCVGYMLGYNDGRTGLFAEPEHAIAAHRKTALVLHPEWGLRDPYGVLTRATVGTLVTYANGWLAGVRRVEHRSYVVRYAELRDALLEAFDVPPTLAAAVALYLLRPNEYHFLSFTVVF